MREINLFCAAGMSTSLLVSKMQKYAAEIGYDCHIEAFPISKVDTQGAKSDIILLGPQVRFEKERVSEMYPNKIVESINMQAYGMMDGPAIIKQVKEKLGD